VQAVHHERRRERQHLEETEVSEIKRREPTGLAWHQPQNMDDAIGLAKLIWRSGLAPRGLDTAEKVFVAMATGHEFGFPPFTSLRAIDVYLGMPSLKASTMRAKVQSSPACEWLSVLETSDTVCRMQTQRRGNPKPSPIYSYTIKDAERAELLRTDNSGRIKKDNWRKDPKAMLIARCSTLICRAEYPDVVLGVYTRDEIDEMRREDAAVAAHILPQASGALAGAISYSDTVSTQAPADPPQQPTQTPATSSADSQPTQREPTDNPPAPSPSRLDIETAAALFEPVGGLGPISAKRIAADMHAREMPLTFVSLGLWLVEGHKVPQFGDQARNRALAWLTRKGHHTPPVDTSHSEDQAERMQALIDCEDDTARRILVVFWLFESLEGEMDREKIERTIDQAVGLQPPQTPGEWLDLYNEAVGD
jgi:hypothetical protein